MITRRRFLSGMAGVGAGLLTVPALVCNEEIERLSDSVEHRMEPAPRMPTWKQCVTTNSRNTPSMFVGGPMDGDTKLVGDLWHQVVLYNYPNIEPFFVVHAPQMFHHSYRRVRVLYRVGPRQWFTRTMFLWHSSPTSKIASALNLESGDEARFMFESDTVEGGFDVQTWTPIGV